MSRTLSRLIALAALAIALPALAVDPAVYETAFQQFQRAAAGDKDAIEPAAQQFAGLSAAEPADPVLLAYAGAATSMRAKTTLLPWKKMSFAEDAPAHEQLLHKGAPATLETRFIAASTFLALPSMFNRQPRGAKLLDDVLASPQLTAAPLGFRGAVWLRAGVAALTDKRPDDARRWFQQVISSGAPQAPAAQARLKELS